MSLHEINKHILERKIMQVEKVEVKKLKMHPRYYEFFDSLTDNEFENLFKRIKENGILNPILITDKNVVVSGWQRVCACVKLGIETIPCIIREYEDEDQVLKDMLVSNAYNRGTMLNSSLNKSRKRREELKRLSR